MVGEGVVIYLLFQFYYFVCSEAFITEPSIHLMFVNGSGVNVEDLDSGIVTNIVRNQSRTYSMDYHNVQKYIYWTDTVAGTISRVRYPSEEKSAPKVIAKTVTPTSIAVDTVDNHVYWVQYGLNGNIIRCNLNGSNETVILKNLHDTFGITLDSKRRWMYFSGYAIEKSKLDGSERQTIHKEKESFILCLSIDSDEGRLYWTDFLLGGIKSSRLDGSDVSVIIKSSPKSLHAINVYSNFIYYSDSNRHMILKVNKTTGSEPTAILNNTIGLGIHICPFNRQRVYKPQLSKAALTYVP